MSSAVEAHVLRVDWLPGSDHLVGVCFCRAEHVADDPIALWEWLHGHPQGHDVLPVPVGTDGVPVPAYGRTVAVGDA